MGGPRTVAHLLEVGERVLRDSSHIFEDHDHRGEAEALLAFALRKDLGELRDELELSPRARDRYLALVARRAAGEPFPLLVGQMTFYGLDLKVRPGTFMPRPSSELLVQRASRRLRTSPPDAEVVDVCTGAGPIALALAHEFPEARVWGLDISEPGLAQARSNARRLGIHNTVFRQSDMYASLPPDLHNQVALITAHVPYVPANEVESLPSEVKEHEPIESLTDRSDDGLYLARRAVEESTEWLKPGGWLLMEMSEDLAAKARRYCRTAGLEDKGIGRDRYRLSVVVEARMPRSKPARSRDRRGKVTHAEGSRR